MLKTIKKYHNFLFLFLSVILVTPSVLGMLHVGFPLTDDGNWMVIRFSAFYEALRSGQFPVRFLTRLNNGYGYPVADFLYPLFMYLGVPIHVIGLSFVNTIKLLIILSLFSASGFSFLWLKKIFDNQSALVGALFYALFPYLLFDVYTRGSVGEVLALTILPFVLWQIERKSLLLASIGIGALIISHNTLSFLFMPFIIGYIFVRSKKFSKFNLLSFLFGLGLSSFFWIPAIYDLQYTVFTKTKVSDFSSYFINNNLNFLGIISLFLILESAFYLIRKKDKFFLILFLVFMFLVFLTLSYSLPLWKIIPFSNLIQFPFRIISLIIPLGAFMSAYLINKEKFFKKSFLVGIYLILIFISGFPFMYPKSFQTFPDTFYSTNQDTTTVKNEYMPKWVKEALGTYNPERVSLLTGQEQINTQSITSNKIIFNTFLPVNRTAQINIVYFPGWNAYVNGVKKEILPDNPSGLMRLSLSKGENNVVLKFSETPVRILGDFISLISLFGIMGFAVLLKKKKLKI